MLGHLPLSHSPSGRSKQPNQHAMSTAFILATNNLSFGPEVNMPHRTCIPSTENTRPGTLCRIGGPCKHAAGLIILCVGLNFIMWHQCQRLGRLASSYPVGCWRGSLGNQASTALTNDWHQLRRRTSNSKYPAAKSQGSDMKHDKPPSKARSLGAFCPHIRPWRPREALYSWPHGRFLMH